MNVNTLAENILRPECSCDPTFLWELSPFASHQVVEKCHVNAGHCHMLNVYTTLIFLFLVTCFIYRLFRFWFSVSEKFTSSVNFLYITFISICTLRALRFSLIQYFEVSNELLNFLYYAPLVLMFTGISVLALMWQEMFSVVTGRGGNARAKLLHATIIGNVFVACSTMVLLQMDSRLCPLPVFLACPIFLHFYNRQGFKKWRNSVTQANGPRAVSFPTATKFAMISFGGFFLFVTVSVAFAIVNFTQFSGHSHLIRHSIHILEIFFLGYLIVTVYKLSKLTILPMPETIDSEWLTAMFREKGAMRYTNHIDSIFGEKQLTGGCHSAVRKMELSFLEKTDWLPRAVVVKVLTWDKSFRERVNLAVRGILSGSFETKEVSYLKSYSIEAKFYKQIAPEVHGIKIPRVYYNHNDKFNNKFGMVMEDITFSETNEQPSSGQPNGFTFAETRIILSQLAKFHAWFWEHPDLSQYDVWNIAGYYTGSKRVQFKNQVESHWSNVILNLGDQLNIKHKKSFGSRLFQNRKALNSVYSREKLKTLVHGDYKISNIFVDQPQANTNFTSPGEGDVHVIDWQWVGLGIGAIDVAYFLATSTVLDTVQRSSMKKLVKIYHSILVEKGVKNYTFKEMWIDFRLSFIDFIVYVICCKWSSMTPADFVSNQNGCKDGLHIRSLAHAQKLITIAESFMDSLSFDQ